MEAPITTGPSEEVKDAVALIRVWHWVLRNKKEIAITFALLGLYLKGDTSILEFVGKSIKNQPPVVYSIPKDAPVAETWKNSVDRRLTSIEKKQNTIIRLLTDQ